MTMITTLVMTTTVLAMIGMIDAMIMMITMNDDEDDDVVDVRRNASAFPESDYEKSAALSNGTGLLTVPVKRTQAEEHRVTGRINMASLLFASPASQRQASPPRPPETHASLAQSSHRWRAAIRRQCSRRCLGWRRRRARGDHAHAA